MAKLEALQKNIETLRSAIPELRGVLIASTEGLPVAHSIAGGADPARVAAMADRIAAMAAAAVNLGKRVSESLSVGALVEISVTGAEGQIFLYSAGTKGVLAVIAPKGGNAGLVHLEARAVAKDVGDQCWGSLVGQAIRLPWGGSTVLTPFWIQSPRVRIVCFLTAILLRGCAAAAAGSNCLR